MAEAEPRGARGARERAASRRYGLTIFAALAVALIGAPAARGDEALPVSEAAAAPRRWFVHANFGVNVYTYNAATATTAAQHLTPADRINLGQQLGVGYYFLPYLRLQVTAQLGETVTGRPPGMSPLALVAVIPWVVFTMKGGFVGTGPFLAPRAFARNDLELGWFFSAGYAFRLPRGFALSLAVQVPVTFLDRVSVQLTPLVSLSYRF